MFLQAPPFDDVVDRARRAEVMGFDSVWVADHMTGQYPTLIAYEAWTLLSVLATVTTRVRLGALVTPITFRHPSLLAMEAVTVDHASAGRLEIGLGIGGSGIDASVVGQPVWPGPERVARLEEQIDVLDRLLRGERVDGHTGFYPTDGAVVARPVQVPRPPITVAGTGPRLLDLAARRAEAWNTLGGQPMRGTGRPPVSLDEAVAATAGHVRTLGEACVRAGRAPASIRRTLLAYRVAPQLFASIGAFEDYVGRYVEIGMDELVFYWPADPATFERVPEYERGLERIAAEVLPRLRNQS